MTSNGSCQCHEHDIDTSALIVCMTLICDERLYFFTLCMEIINFVDISKNLRQMGK